MDDPTTPQIPIEASVGVDEHEDRSLVQRLINPTTMLVLLFLGSVGFLVLPNSLKAMWMFYVLAGGIMFDVIWSLVREIRS
jgi:hypothetical protein